MHKNATQSPAVLGGGITTAVLGSASSAKGELLQLVKLIGSLLIKNESLDHWLAWVDCQEIRG